MLDFRKITKSDFAEIDRYYKENITHMYAGDHRICDYAPGTVKMWCRAYDMEYAIHRENLYLSAVYDDSASRSYLYPLGPDEKKGVGGAERSYLGNWHRSAVCDSPGVHKFGRGNLL